jgi:signal transduction histidine kinase
MVVRDVTTDARREQARAALLDQITLELEDEPLSAPQSDGAAEFAQQARRREVALGKLLVELRELTNVDSQIIRRAQRSIPLEMLIHAAANEWRAVASAANLNLDVIIEQNGLMVSGDERRLRWAIGNILDNAIKYTPPGGRLALEVKGTEGGYARLRVRDNGAGISPDDLPRVFDRFYRGEAMASSGRVIQVPGTGLGLPIAREIIEAHGGLITVRSTPGIGTAVYFTLPLEGTPLPAIPPSPDEEADEDMGETARFRL